MKVSKRALGHLVLHPRSYVDDVAHGLGCTVDAAEQALEYLYEQGRVVRERGSWSGAWMYSRSDTREHTSWAK